MAKYEVERGPDIPSFNIKKKPPGIGGAIAVGLLILLGIAALGGGGKDKGSSPAPSTRPAYNSTR